MSVVYCIGTKDAMGELGHPLQWKNDTGGGTKSFFMNIVKELPKHGHGVHVFSTFSQYVDDCGVQYHPIEEISNFQTPHVLWACYDLRWISPDRVTSLVQDRRSLEQHRHSYCSESVHGRLPEANIRSMG